MALKQFFYLTLLGLIHKGTHADVLLNGSKKYTQEQVFVDHEDRNLFYIAPQGMTIAEAKDGSPQIRYIEYFKRGRRLKGQLDFVMAPRFTHDLNSTEAMIEVKKMNPYATFKAPPYKLIHLDLSSGDKRFVKSFKCDIAKKAVILSFPCSVQIRPSLVEAFRDAIDTGKILNLDFVYEIPGKVKTTKGGRLLDGSVRVQATGLIDQRYKDQFPHQFSFKQ